MSLLTTVMLTDLLNINMLEDVLPEHHSSGVFNLLLEDGNDLLLEDGGLIILETATP